MDLSASTPAAWRQSHIGHWLRLALERFDARVLEIMAHHPSVPLGLSNLAARDQVSAAHIHITRHLSEEGLRPTELAARAGMTKQAMATLITQCEAWGMVQRDSPPGDKRARRITFTATGLAWLHAYRDAVAQAQDEMRAALNPEVCTVIALGLEAYCQ